MKRISAHFVYLSRNKIFAKGILSLNPFSANFPENAQCEPANTEFYNGILCPHFVSLKQNGTTVPDNYTDFENGKFPSEITGNRIFDFGEMPYKSIAKLLFEIQQKFPQLNIFEMLAFCCDNPLAQIQKKQENNVFLLIEHIDLQQFKFTNQTTIREIR